MDKIANYTLLECIHETGHSIVYRGQKEEESQPVIIKLLKTMYPTPSDIARFRQEYELIKTIHLDGVIKTFDLISQDNKFLLILEDFNGVSIKRILNKQETFDLKSFLDIAAKIAHILGELHVKKVIHRDIKPHNILLNQQTGMVKITDFGISMVLTHSNDEIFNPDFIAGTLPYMSPEQTGRMNRGVDYRTDLYSFGVTLYEMLTGYIPFNALDPMELIHSHIAIMPEPPAAKDSTIPMVLSDIIMRLLSKNPEERYQNSFGLEADFRECIRKLNKAQEIGPFELGRHDISNRFIIPPKLFGRENEINALISGFNAVAVHQERAAVMAVAGHPGIGKSALINELYKPIVARRGYFISGKYEQFRRDKPYSAIIQAFQVLMRHLLSESEEKISTWREKILEAVGTSGRVITDVIPDVELIIGKQPALPVLDPEETRNRFNSIFERFISIFSKQDHPVVLFLDDLQWADLASLQFLKNILTGSTLDYFYLIISYRDNDDGEAYQVMDFLRHVEKNALKVDSVTLGALKIRDIKNFLLFFLKCSERDGQVLAEIVAKKTGGNPFFINLFMHNIYNEKMIVHKGVHGWQWDAEKINRMQMTDNMVDMLAMRIGKLSENAQAVLKICACIGNRFDLETLAAVRETSVYQALVDLTEALDKEMVSRHGNMYVFHHDRIQESAYSLVPDTEKSALHYKIGRLTLDRADENERQNKLFYIVDQLNMGANMISDEKERAALARLNLESGIKAKESAAYHPSLHYLQTGIDLLDYDAWNSQYALILGLYTEMVEACYLLGEFPKMTTMAEQALKNAKNILDKERIYFNLINALKAQRDYEGAIQMALPVLKAFGLRLPKNPSQLRVLPVLLRTMIKFRGVTVDRLFAMDSNPQNEKEEKLIAMGHILATLGHAAFFINPNLFGLVTLKGINLSWKMNTCSEDVPFAIAAFGVIRLAGFGDIDGAYKLGNIALQMAQKLNLRKMASRLYFVHNMLIRHWKEPMQNAIEGGMEGFRIGKETGDLEYAAWNLHIYATIGTLLGKTLPAFEQEIASHNKLLNEMNQDSVRTLNAEVWQTMHCLMGRADDPLRIKGEVFDEDEIVPRWIKEKNRPALAVYFLLKLFLQCVFHNHSLSMKNSASYLRYRDAIIGCPPDSHFPFLDSFARFYALDKVSWPKRTLYLGRIRINRWKLKRWARYCPENKLQLYYVVDTMWDMVVGKNIGRALAKADLLIKTAREHNDIVIESIANEMTGRYILALDETAATRFFLGRRHKGAREKTFISASINERAKHYLTAAYYCYEKWGATAKLTQLQTLYPAMFQSLDAMPEKADTDTGSTSSRNTSMSLDMSSVMKASQAISEEIVLANLLSKMMKIVMENAGAQRGYLFLASEGELTIEASNNVDTGEFLVMQSVPIHESGDFSQAIVNYVHHSGENVILGNAAKEGPFINDPYVMRTHCKSVLCTPIMNKGVLTGIVYMENNLSVDAFTQERFEMLRALSTQAAISIENARLFELATTDGMTKLYMHSYFQRLLDREIKHAHQNNTELALILTDIDNFKLFNDTYGHQMGDVVLTRVAKAVKSTLRAGDIAARYGGEEFVVILPETSGQQAMKVAEKIRGDVASLLIPHESMSLSVTISLGVAVFPIHAVEKELLIRSADMALYASKHSGKNCVTLYNPMQ
ncbi:MAG: diguanylate cyclase [Thermodesulfobacteriota bacterium]|nr:diguanylate cyclase [Thermodesulfobacteriota bacterium]